MYFLLAVLVLFLTKELMFNNNKGKSVYHAFSMVSYFTGVLGAMLADSFLGKYRSGKRPQTPLTSRCCGLTLVFFVVVPIRHRTNLKSP